MANKKINIINTPIGEFDLQAKETVGTLTITGAATGTFNGSENKTINIPTDATTLAGSSKQEIINSARDGLQPSGNYALKSELFSKKYDELIDKPTITLNGKEIKNPNFIAPVDEGEVKTRFNISLKTFPDQAGYYPLCTLPHGATGYSSCIITGRVGGWTANETDYVQCLITNRQGIGFQVVNIRGGNGNNAAYNNHTNIVVYQEDNENQDATVYIKCQGYALFNINISLYQKSCKVLWNGQTTKPTGTEKISLFTTKNILKLEGGKAYIANDEIITKIYGDKNYLEKTEKAKDSDKLDGHESTYYIHDAIAQAGTHINETGIPTVTVNNSNSQSTFTFDYLKGEQGPQGPRGPQGPGGLTTTDATTLQGSSKQEIINSAKSGLSTTSHTHVFTGQPATGTCKVTASGSVGTPTITVTAPTSNISVNSITGVGSLPSLTTSYDSTSQTLSFSFSQGSLPTKLTVSKTFVTSVSATSSKPSFTGSESSGTATVTAEGTISTASE